jgi:hypothetical protein
LNWIWLFERWKIREKVPRLLIDWFFRFSHWFSTDFRKFFRGFYENTEFSWSPSLKIPIQAKIDFLNFFWPEYSKFSIYFRRINRQVPLKKINFSLYIDGQWWGVLVFLGVERFGRIFMVVTFFLGLKGEKLWGNLENFRRELRKNLSGFQLPIFP